MTPDQVKLAFLERSVEREAQSRHSEFPADKAMAIQDHEQIFDVSQVIVYLLNEVQSLRNQLEAMRGDGK